MSEGTSAFPLTAQLEALLAGRDLSGPEATAVFEAIVGGQVGASSMGAFLTALRMKGESPAELAAFAAVMRAHARRISAPPGTLDTCGTGGDGAQTFNISTAVALVLAGMGVPVAKHGNRAVSGNSGSADVLRVLGVNVDASLEIVQCCLREVGMCFLFAPLFHPGMKHASPIRKELGIRTVFNLLGPLSNPAGSDRQLVGVFSARWCRPLAEALRTLGSRRALVVCGPGPDGRGSLDEISLWGPTHAARLNEAGAIIEEEIDPAALGFAAPPAAALNVTSAEGSAKIIRSVLAGRPGPARDAVLLNAAAAAQVAGRAGSWEQGLTAAAAALDEGKATAALERLVKASNA
jgi:anthranilate phosphoribosyltransferase